LLDVENKALVVIRLINRFADIRLASGNASLETTSEFNLIQLEIRHQLESVVPALHKESDALYIALTEFFKKEDAKRVISIEFNDQIEIA
ncbi:MAG: hypothetical protein ACRESU_10395, partial [Gammaproteobacteria bacterium]